MFVYLIGSICIYFLPEMSPIFGFLACCTSPPNYFCARRLQPSTGLSGCMPSGGLTVDREAYTFRRPPGQRWEECELPASQVSVIFSQGFC